MNIYLFTIDTSIVCAETVNVRLSSDIPEELWSAVSAQRRQLDFHASQISVLRVFFWSDVCDATDDTDEERDTEIGDAALQSDQHHAYERME